MGTGIKIEVLYGEFANLFGELQNVNYLKSCIPDAEVIYTGLHDKPAFADGGADFVYMGSMTENQQELAIEALTPYKEELAAQIDAGTVFLFTGNAMEIMEMYIENEDGSKITGLAAKYQKILQEDGYEVKGVGNATGNNRTGLL
mgnify:FL=1